MSFSYRALFSFWGERRSSIPEIADAEGLFHAVPLTRRDLLLELHVAAREILENPNGKYPFSPDFTAEECLDPLWRAYIRIGHVMTPSFVGEEELQQIHEALPGPIQKMANYFERYGEHYRDLKNAAEKDFDKEETDMLCAVEGRNVDKVLFYFEEAAGRLYKGGKFGVPEKNDPTGGLMRTMMARNLLQIMDKNGVVLSDRLENKRDEIGVLEREAVRGESLCEELTFFAENLVATFGLYRPVGGKVLRFPERRLAS